MTERKTLPAKPAVVPDNSDSVWAALKRGPLKVAIIGSGNWGSTIARIVGNNTRSSYIFHTEVKLWVFEEVFEGRKLSEIINTDHENKKYLPGIKLPPNVIAEPDVVKAAEGANLLVFVMPHQFVPSTCKQLAGHVAKDSKAISLIKGFEVEKSEVKLSSDYIHRHLGIETSVLSGANVAQDIAEEQFSETTIGYRNIESAKVFQQLFDTPYFRVNCVPDVAGVELCGALKNVVALAAGFCDGLALGTNTKAAIIRLGLAEMKKFADTLFAGVIDETFWDSCGVADLITTCFGGRNRKCAEVFVKTRESWDVIERKLLGGQKLQGTLTAKDVYNLLHAKNLEKQFPLFTTVYQIAFENLDPKALFSPFMGDTPRPITQLNSKL